MALPVWLASARTALRRMRIFRSGTARAQGAMSAHEEAEPPTLPYPIDSKTHTEALAVSCSTGHTSTVSVLLCMRMLLVRNCTCLVQNASTQQDGRFPSLLSAQVSSQEYPGCAAC